MAANPTDRAPWAETSSRQRHEEDHSEGVRRVFDGWVRSGEALGMERRHKRLAELMMARFGLPRDARLLDIGCGTGWTARMLADRIPEGAFVGIDASAEMILEARRSCADLDNVLFAPASAEQIPWAENYFTHVISIESAYYWSETMLASREIFRVLAYGGSFHILINYFAENEFSEGWGRDMGLRLHRMGAEEWEAVFRGTGFEEVRSDRIPDDSPISPGKPPRELERRKGLQRVGALYVTGCKPALPEQLERETLPSGSPFRIVG